MSNTAEAGPVIREATSGDVHSVAQLIRRAFADVARQFDLNAENCPSHPSLCRSSWVATDMGGGARYYLCLDGQELRGCYGLVKNHEHGCRLDKLAVAPEHQGRGTGTMLLEDARRRAAQAGAELLEVSILYENSRLMRWYTRRGFELSGTARYPHLPFTVGFLFADV
ncbi:MAG: GNAT family N-acetyltransferase [Chitinivibrionales bacterium]|nr:GNAT family N-acetyltransferase [Chitinivibrionales bacterium]